MQTKVKTKNGTQPKMTNGKPTLIRPRKQELLTKNGTKNGPTATVGVRG